MGHHSECGRGCWNDSKHISTDLAYVNSISFSKQCPSPHQVESWLANTPFSRAFIGGGSPVYPTNQSPTGKTICSATYGCYGPEDLWNAPTGTVALSFDDGPLAPSPRLYAFLKQNNVHATHFFIGGNIRESCFSVDPCTASSPWILMRSCGRPKSIHLHASLCKQLGSDRRSYVYPPVHECA